MKFYLILLLLIISATSLYSQSAPLKGYIINTAGDTIQGEVYPDDDAEMIMLLHFKATGSSAVEEFSPSQLNSFFFGENNYYESVSIDGMKGFLQCLVKGYLTLYVYPGKKNEQQYYLKTNDGKWVLLNNTTKLVTMNGSTFKKAGNEYIGNLKIVMADAQELYSEINKSKLRDADMSNLVLKYNLLKQPEVSSGVHFSKSGYTSHKGLIIGTAEYFSTNSEMALRIGALLSLRPKKPQVKWQLNAGMFYTNADYGPIEPGVFTIEFPLYASYYFVNSKRINISGDFGMMPQLFFDKYYYDNKWRAWLFSPFSIIMGVSIDYKIKNDYIKFKTGLEGGSFTLGLGYMF
jgi:hypothetical protein